MTMTANNGVRKSLSDQIDRLDQVLDGLADGLNGTVAQAVREVVGLAVKEAVHAVLIEVLGNPAMLEKLRGSTAVTTPAPHTTLLARLRCRTCAWACAGWAHVRAVCAFGVRQVRNASDAALYRVRMLWHFRGPLVVAVSVGGAAGVAAFFAGPLMTATATAMAGFTATAAAQSVLALRRVLAYASFKEGQL